MVDHAVNDVVPDLIVRMASRVTSAFRMAAINLRSCSFDKFGPFLIGAVA